MSDPSTPEFNWGRTTSRGNLAVTNEPAPPRAHLVGDVKGSSPMGTRQGVIVRGVLVGQIPIRWDPSFESRPGGDPLSYPLVIGAISSKSANTINRVRSAPRSPSTGSRAPSWLYSVEDPSVESPEGMSVGVTHRVFLAI